MSRRVVAALGRSAAAVRRSGAAVRRRLSDERGFTLIEVLTALLIGGIVLAGAMSVFQAGQRASARVQDRAESVQRGRVVMEQLTQRVRSQVCLGPGYPALTQGDANGMTFYMDIGDETFRPQQMRLTYDPATNGGQITETTWDMSVSGSSPSGWQVAGSPSRVRVLATNLSLSGSTPFFQYYSFTSTDPIAPTNLLPVPLSPADLARVVQVVLTYRAEPMRGNQNAFVAPTFQNQVYVRTADPTDPIHSPLCV